MPIRPENKNGNTLYDWRVAPEGATHGATDKNTDSWWFYGRPFTWGGVQWAKSPQSRIPKFMGNSPDVLSRVDWQKSLEEKPRSKTTMKVGGK